MKTINECFNPHEKWTPYKVLKLSGDTLLNCFNPHEKWTPYKEKPYQKTTRIIVKSFNPHEKWTPYKEN